jgi:hypothetical protein
MGKTGLLRLLGHLQGFHYMPSEPTPKRVEKLALAAYCSFAILSLLGFLVTSKNATHHSAHLSGRFTPKHQVFNSRPGCMLPVEVGMGLRLCS